GRVPNTRTQIELAQAAVDEGMSAADLSRLANYFVANPNLTLETALQALERGEQLRQRPVPEVTISGGPLPRTSPAAGDDSDDDDLWLDAEEPVDDDPEYIAVGDMTIENQPANKARTFRIRSLDQMIDETERLSRAYVEGDLNKWVSQDQSAPMKMRLLLKQLNTLLRGLREIAQTQGWQDVDN
ncbi:MAG: chromosome partitioning protein ParB, partial [Chloroflexaceae bacterium]|nr:chromosome partitioning protein ParB [Chloroflexaceae bacterium]